MLDFAFWTSVSKIGIMQVGNSGGTGVIRMADSTFPKTTQSGVNPIKPSLGLPPGEVLAPPATLTGPALIGVPRCAFRLEKTPHGCNIFCVTEDPMACSMMQQLGKKLSGGPVTLGCMFNGRISFHANLAMAGNRVESTTSGVNILLSSNEPQSISLLQLYGDTWLASLEGGQSCSILINGTPICTGLSQVFESAMTPWIEKLSSTLNLESVQGEIDKLRQAVARLTAERDAYHRVALEWAAAQVTQEEIQLYSREEPGLPLESFIDELENLQGQ